MKTRTPLRGYLEPDMDEVWLDDFVEPGQVIAIREDFDMDPGSGPPIGYFKVVRVDIERQGWILTPCDTVR